MLQAEEGEQKEILRYGLRCFLGDFVKVIMLGVLFGIAGCLYEFILVCMVLVILRTLCGGTHRETMQGCFLQSLIIILLIIICGKNIVIPKEWLFEVYGTLIIMMMVITPVISQKRMRYTRVQCIKFKIRAMLVLIGMAVLSQIIDARWSNYFIWVGIIQVVDTLVAKLIANGKENKYEQH